MNEELAIARKIVANLDRGLNNLTPDVETRLHAARRAALAHQRVAARGLTLAGIGRTVSDLWGQYNRLTLVTLTAAFVLVAADAVRENVLSSELEEVDSALLSDDLPIDAYLDHGFDRWLKPDDSAS
ncbi:hypothetical protein GCM10025771_23950 [Niveibacterium umoris]|uniref:DUF3619 family protein n=1 Tax=Niveibacterium umoris TaxID=1193620 RepID=A0A840BPQ7_9RHOO|nr:DUF3619 family protein [Niveibacterium umoris]MBB4012417.1 hypothetical protein [Niveibacterium umoris]